MDIANPTAMLLSAIEMLNYIGENEKAINIKNALLETLKSGIKTKDLGGNAKCSEFTDAVIKQLR